jgi:single-strand DNA-binding protein
MSNDTMVTVQGWLGNDPQLREAAGTRVANFRVGCTPRRYNRVRGEWIDGPTQWYGVSAWRILGEHCKSSLHVGDPVIVHGRLNQRTYDRNGVEVTAMEIEAITVGHDLSRGISSFSKTVGSTRRDQQAEPDPAAVRDPWAVESPGSQAESSDAA